MTMELKTKKFQTIQLLKSFIFSWIPPLAKEHGANEQPVACEGVEGGGGSSMSASLIGQGGEDLGEL